MRRKARWVVQDSGPRKGAHRVAVCLLLILAAIASHRPAIAQDAKLMPIVIALPEGPSARTIGYHLAKAEGAFAREGFDARLVAADRRGATKMLADGDVDLAVGLMPNALKARAGGADIVNVAQIFQHSGLVLVCRHPIEDGRDLRGMYVSLWSGGQESPFYAWAAKIGLGIYGEADGVTILREGLDPDAFRSRASDCFTSETYVLPAQLALQGKTVFDYRIFSYEELGTALLEDGVYVRAKDLEYPDRVQRIAHVLAAMRAGWQSAADGARKAADFLAATDAPPTPDIATLLRSIWAANDLVAIDKIPFGHLNPAAYDRTVTVLLTAAPDPLLKTAPLGATTDAVTKVLGTLE